MPQISSWTIPNSGGSTFRANLNNALAALQSTNSGTTAPPQVAGMLWFDTANGVLKRRNAANTGWIEVNADTVAATTVRGNASGSEAAETSISMASLRTMLGFSQTLGTAQVQELPGGAMIQSGTGATGAGSVTITFPTAFSADPKVAFAVQTGAGARLVTCQSLNGFTMLVQGWTFGGAATNVGFSYIAMGY